MNSTNKRIVIYVLVTYALTSFIWIPWITGAVELPSGGGLLGILLMWMPGLAGIGLHLFHNKTLRGMGLRLGKPKYLIEGYVLPICILAPTYLLIWFFGISEFNPDYLTQRISDAIGSEETLSLGWVLLIQATIGFATVIPGVIGEEIGWRGYLVPLMAKKMGLLKLSVISGLIWAAWHYPLFLVGHAEETNPVQHYLLYTPKLIAYSIIVNWLRLKSNSIWPAVFIHSSSNLWMEGVFNDLTVTNDMSRLLVDDTGFGVMICMFIISFIYWKRRHALPQLADD